jgi:outer membrane protein OmpA-like peptidoglycan-associated protein
MILLGICPLQSQDLSTKNKKAEKFYIEGEDYLKKRLFDDALKSFEKAIEKDPQFAEPHYQMGLLYKTYLRDISKLKFHYQKVLSINPDFQVSSVFRVLGETYLHEGNYLAAKDLFTKYLSFKNEPQVFVEKTKTYISHCNFAIEQIKNPVKINPKMLPNTVNNHKKQYFPVSTADQQQLVFTIRDNIGFQEYEDIFVSKKINGEWGQPESISDNINTPYLNEGTCSISADGKILVFTVCNEKGKNKTDCDLHISYKEGGVWSKPVSLGENVNSPYWDSQPSLSPDGKTIYFASKRPGGMGEEDIWMVQADVNGRWGVPLNMGDLINTAGREVAPFIHPSMSTLYFASDFHPGFGSFDLFVSYKDSVNWSVPKNLGYPINTHLEESSIFITSDCKKAYFSAEALQEKVKERYFLYEFEVPKEASCQQLSTYAKGTIYDNETKKPIGATIELINLKTKKSESNLSSDPVDGDYLVVLNENSQYGLYVTRPGYLYKSHSFDFENATNFDPLNLDVYLDPIKQGSFITLNNIFFETGKYTLEKKSASELNKLVNFLNQNPDLKVEISGHTDNVGLKSTNLQLSTKRAESVVDYLLENGIDTSKIKFKGYGDAQPVAPNDTEETRKLNRRIECKIL